MATKTCKHGRNIKKYGAYNGDSKRPAKKGKNKLQRDFGAPKNRRIAASTNVQTLALLNERIAVERRAERARKVIAGAKKGQTMVWIDAEDYAAMRQMAA